MTTHGQLIRTIGAAILASTALTSSGRECLSLYLYSAADCNATCKRRRKSLRRYRLERASQEQSKETHKTLHDCWGRKRMKMTQQINDGASTPVAGATEASE
ncbi:hypothetical protein EVAR_31139_1 [Eumeta japonica]|uniref:Uncharacterized protein n=1 Tax=Eumeta variegata TaxID=151549 RepID=A0A4C1VDK3_EUMVA|nr:hypothetical protein EVAR_31139_1 [Eumeta japonica]